MNAQNLKYNTTTIKHLSAVTLDMALEPGTNYVASVEACNTVHLCVTAESAVMVADSSPPLPGVVMAGYGGEHNYYHSSK